VRFQLALRVAAHGVEGVDLPVAAVLLHARDDPQHFHRIEAEHFAEVLEGARQADHLIGRVAEGLHAVDHYESAACGALGRT